MSNFVRIQDLDLSKATIIGYNGCHVELQGSDLICFNLMGRAVVKYPFELESRFALYRGLPEEIGIDEEGGFEIFNIDFDDEDYFGDEEQPDFILEGYSYLATSNFTIIIKN